MQYSIASHTTRSAQSSSSISTICQTRTDLLDQLAATLANLSHATLGLASAIESGNPVQYGLAEFELEQLREDCSKVKIELERHRARHGC